LCLGNADRIIRDAKFLDALNHLLCLRTEGYAIRAINLLAHGKSLFLHTGLVWISELKRLAGLVVNGIHHQSCQFLGSASTLVKGIIHSKSHSYAVAMLTAEVNFLVGIRGKTIEAHHYGLPERLQNEYNIMISGPSTITALLNSLSLGFRIAAINEKANEVRKILSAVKSQYETFSGVLAKAKKKIDEAGKSLDEAQHRNDMIQKKLKAIEEVDVRESDNVLGISDAPMLDAYSDDDN
jgi:hypothetical protein